MNKPLDFPIPFPGQTADDDLAIALNLIEVVTTALENGGGMTQDTVTSLLTTLCQSANLLEQVLVFLDKLEAPEQAAMYAAARREWITSKGGAK
jgi:hypothetical protein